MNQAQHTTPEVDSISPAFEFSKENFENPKPLLIQPKLTIGAVDDPFEREADAMADRVMRMPDSSFIQRKCASCEEEEKINRIPETNFLQKKCASCEHEEEKISRKITPFIQKSISQTPPSGAGGLASESVTNQINASRGGGSRMSENTLSFMESRFGTDFSGVKIHTDSNAAQMSRDLNAQAFTVGSDIYFNSGKYAPESDSGKHLLAHELTHTVQQGGGIERKVQRQGVLEPPIPTMPSQDIPILTFGLINPYEEDSDEEMRSAYEASREVRENYRQELIGATTASLFRRRGDAMTFLSRLRGLTDAQRSFLLENDNFLDRVRPVFRGRSLWSVYTQLQFGNNLYEPHLRLKLGISLHNAQLVADMLSLVIGHYSNDRYYNILREVVVVEFVNDPLLPEILRLIDHRNDAGISNRMDTTYREVHYEQNATGGQSLRAFGGQLSANTYFSGNQLRVIVRMRFLDGDNQTSCPTTGASGCSSFYFLGENASHYQRYQEAMTRYWNNKFSVTNGVNTYSVVFVPIFMTEPDNDAVQIRVITDRTKSCNSTSSPGRSEQTCWFLEVPDSTIAHEFGHIIGASDEYRLPGSYQEVIADPSNFNLTPEDMQLSTVEGIRGVARPTNVGGYSIADSIMNDNSNNAQPRHLTRMMRLLNTGLPARVPPFTLHKI
jgi:ribosomal protein S27E